MIRGTYLHETWRWRNSENVPAISIFIYTVHQTIFTVPVNAHLHAVVPAWVFESLFCVRACVQAQFLFFLDRAFSITKTKINQQNAQLILD